MCIRSHFIICLYVYYLIIDYKYLFLNLILKIFVTIIHDKYLSIYCPC